MRIVAAGNLRTPFRMVRGGGDDGVPAHVVVQRHRVDRRVNSVRAHQRRQGRGKAQRAVRLRQVQRLDAEAVAHQREAPAVALVDGEGEHAVEALDRARAPLGPGLDDDLGVAGRGEAVALALELGAEFGIVVDAAVKRDGQPEMDVGEGLRRRLGQVDDLQPPVRHADGAAQDHAGAVRPARRHRLGHPLEPRRRGGAAVKADLAADAAHGRVRSSGVRRPAT